MAKQVATDRPLSHEEVGVIGSLDNAVANPDAARFEITPTEVQLRPADADNVFTSHPADFASVQPEPEQPVVGLPEGFEDWEAYKRANTNAKEYFAEVVFFPGAVFRAGGRYHDAKNLDKVYDVTEGQIVPDGLYLFPSNYLADQRPRATNTAPTAQPNPLRSNSRKES